METCWIYRTGFFCILQYLGKRLYLGNTSAISPQSRSVDKMLSFFPCMGSSFPSGWGYVRGGRATGLVGVITSSDCVLRLPIYSCKDFTPALNLWMSLQWGCSWNAGAGLLGRGSGIFAKSYPSFFKSRDNITSPAFKLSASIWRSTGVSILLHNHSPKLSNFKRLQVSSCRKSENCTEDYEYYDLPWAGAAAGGSSVAYETHIGLIGSFMSRQSLP